MRIEAAQRTRRELQSWRPVRQVVELGSLASEHMTQCAKTKIQSGWFLIAVISFVSALVLPYLEGRSNSLWMIPPMLPATVLPFLLLFVSSVALAWCWIRSILAKHDSFAVGVMLSLAVVLFVSSIILRPSYLFQRGFCHYAKTVLTADEWRSISRVAQGCLGPEGRLPGPDKNLFDEKEHRALWSNLCRSTQIQKLDPSLMIFVRPEETEIVWGGALAGHRGVIVFTSKSGNDHQGRLSQAMFIAHDIATIVSAD